MLHIGYIDTGATTAWDELAAAAESAGVRLTPVKPTALTEDSPFDLVISASTAVLKTTSHPTFLTDHQPRASLFSSPQAFANISSYDGYLCVSDTLARFFASVAASQDKPLVEPGAFYPLPTPAAGLDAAITGATVLQYFDDGADGEALRLLHRLSGRPYARRDGQTAPEARLAAYRQAGAGLVWPTQDRLLDDIVPEALFEIASAGAAVLCPDTPWIRARCGDDAWYYQPFRSAEEILADIDQAMAAIAADPAAAAVRARALKARLQAAFGPEALLANLADYHARWTAAAKAQAEAAGDPLIDVIMRVGGRPLAFIERAVASLDRQTAGRFRLILCAYAPIDLEPIGGRSYRRIAEVVTVQAPGGNRARTLAAGLDQVTSPYFCILDDDDYLLTGHMEGLLAAMAGSDSPFRFAYADVLVRDDSADPPGAVRLLRSGPAHGDVFSLLTRFPSHSFLATSATLAKVRYRHWSLSTAEDGLLIGALLRWATPSHSPNATAVYCQGRSDASSFLADARRAEDELALFTEIAAWRSEIEARFPAEAPEASAMIGPFARRMAEDARRRATGDGALLSPWRTLPDGTAANSGIAAWGEDLFDGAFADEPMVFLTVPLDGGRAGGAAVTVGQDQGAPVLDLAPRQPWEVMVRIDIADYAIPGCSVAALAVLDGAREPAILGLLDPAGEMVARSEPPPAPGLIAALVAGPPARPMDAVIVQAGADRPKLGLRLQSLRLGYRLSELAAALGGGDAPADRETLLARLQARIANQVLGAPPSPPSARQPVNFRSRACVFRRLIKDGPFAEGPVRLLGTGDKPWDYFVQIHVPPAAGPAPRWIRVVVGDTSEPFTAFLVDERFERDLSIHEPVSAGKETVEIWLQAPEGGQGVYVVFQCGAAPKDRPMTLRAVEVAA